MMRFLEGLAEGAGLMAWALGVAVGMVVALSPLLLVVWWVLR